MGTEWGVGLLSTRNRVGPDTGLTLMMMIIVSILLFLCPNVRYCGAMTIEIMTIGHLDQKLQLTTTCNDNKQAAMQVCSVAIRHI